MGYSSKPTKHWLSKQGVLAGRLAEQARSLDQIHWLSNEQARLDGTTDEQTDAAYHTIFEQMKREPVMVPLKRIGDF